MLLYTEYIAIHNNAYCSSIFLFGPMALSTVCYWISTVDSKKNYIFNFLTMCDKGNPIVNLAHLCLNFTVNVGDKFSCSLVGLDL